MKYEISNIKQNSVEVTSALSSPTGKILDVLEFFSMHRKPASLLEIAGSTHISKATLLRILNTLMERNYITKGTDKRYFPNFAFTKQGDLPSNLNPIFSESLKKLIAAGCDSAEIITLKKDRLFFHNKCEQHELPSRISVKPGSYRTIYELDAPSRLFLAYLGAQEVSEHFDTERFYDTSYQPRSWGESVDIFSKEDIDEVSYDRTGNSNGIRRFATLMTISDIPFILSVAEIVSPRYNTDTHLNAIVKALYEQRRFILGKIKTLGKT